jgi:hypothetical protein
MTTLPRSRCSSAASIWLSPDSARARPGAEQRPAFPIGEMQGRCVEEAVASLCRHRVALPGKGVVGDFCRNGNRCACH